MSVKLPFSFSDVGSYVSAVSRDLASQKNSIILDQFKDLIKSGVLIIEETEPVIVTNQSPYTAEMEIKLEQAIRLRFKGQEEIERLQAENAALKEQLEAIKTAVLGRNDE